MNQSDSFKKVKRNIRTPDGYKKLSQWTSAQTVELGDGSTLESRCGSWDAAKDHADSAHARTDATKTESSANNGYLKINGTETKVYAHPNTSGYRHIPAGGEEGQILKCSGDGDAAWGNLSASNIFIGVCSTDEGTETKTVECPGFQLNDGVRVMVTFSNGSSTNYMALNVNGTGAYHAWFPLGQTCTDNDGAISRLIAAGCAYEFIFRENGEDSRWVYCGVVSTAESLGALANTGGAVSGNITGSGGGVFAVDGNIYLKSQGYDGWLTNYLGQYHQSKGTFEGDIDTLTNGYKNGSYWIPPTASGTKPFDYYFDLLVFNIGNTNTVQIAVNHRGNGVAVNMYIRNYINNVWSEWNRVLDQKDISNSRGGAGIPMIVAASNADSGGLMEIGKYIDFHDIGSQSDFDARLYCESGKLISTSPLQGVLDGCAKTIANAGDYNRPMTFHYSGQAGQPLYVWGSNTGAGTDNYVWSPSNFNVNSAVKDGNGNVIASTYLPLAGGTITGDLRLKDSTNFGRTLYFGNSSYCYLKEDTDDHLVISANKGLDINVGNASYVVKFNAGVNFYKAASFEKGISVHDTADFYGNMKLRSKLLTADGSNIYQYVANQSIMGSTEKYTVRAFYSDTLEAGTNCMASAVSSFVGASTTGKAIALLHTNHIVHHYWGNIIDLIGVYGSRKDGISFQVDSTQSMFRPMKDNVCDLGAGSARWKNIYASSGTIQTSDRNYKKDIKEFDDDFIIKLIMGLMPRSFKFKENQSDRTHYGFIAQDVEALIDELGITSKDMAGFIKTPHTRKKDVMDENGTIYAEDEVIPEGEEGHGFTYSLRYDEFISPLYRFCQMLYEENRQQRKRIDALENTLQNV